MTNHTPSDELEKILLTNIEHDGSYIPVSAIHKKLPELQAYIQSNYLKRSDVERAINTKIPNWANGAGENEKFIRSMQDKQTRDTIRESLGIGGGE